MFSIALASVVQLGDCSRVNAVIVCVHNLYIRCGEGVGQREMIYRCRSFTRLCFDGLPALHPALYEMCSVVSISYAHQCAICHHPNRSLSRPPYLLSLMATAVTGTWMAIFVKLDLTPRHRQCDGPNRNATHIYISYVTLHYVTLRYITLHCVTLRYIALRCVTLRYVALRCVASRRVASRCVSLRRVAFRCVSLRRIALHYVSYIIYNMPYTI